MSEWREMTLGEITDKIGSGATPRGGKESYVAEGVALIRSMNVLDGRFDAKGLAQITDVQANQLNHVEVAIGDLLVNITGASVARSCIAPRWVTPARVNQHVSIVRLKPALAHPGFVNAYLISPEGKGRLLSLASGGATREALTKATLESFAVRLPPIEMQRDVAAILAALDDLIENNRRRIELLEQMAQAIYREWFVRFRYPGHEDANFVDSPLGPVPEGWKIGVVADLCTLIQAGGTPRRSEPSFWLDGEVDWYKTGELTDSVLIRSSEQISTNALQVSTARVFGRDTILMAIYGSPTVGRLGLIRTPSSANQAALGLVANPDISSTEHLWFVLRDLRDYLNQLAQGAAQQNVSKTKVANTSVMIPSLDLVQGFTDEVGPAWRLTHRLTREVHALAAIRDLLLPKLVTGEIDVSHLDLDAVVGSVA